LALFDTLSAVALVFVIGELFQQGAGELPALAAVGEAFSLAARLHRAAVAPEGLLNLRAAGAAQLLPIGTFSA
jgi:hypothetical protein